MRAGNFILKILTKHLAKIQCILQYFKTSMLKKTLLSKEFVTFRRKYYESSSSFPNWPESKTPMSSLKLHILDDVLIEDVKIIADKEPMLEVDFASKFVGGGVLGRGCVQEEIRFLISPQLIVSRLFTSVLLDTEVLIISGVERFSSYRGYSQDFEYAGSFEDYSSTSNGQKNTMIVAVFLKFVFLLIFADGCD
jgi:poly(ADP-ribose) glycohydrolase